VELVCGAAAASPSPPEGCWVPCAELASRLVRVLSLNWNCWGRENFCGTWEEALLFLKSGLELPVMQAHRFL